MIRPVGDSWQPGFKKFELVVAELAGYVLQKKHRDGFFFVDSPGEKTICDVEQKAQAELLQDFPPEALGGPP